MAKTPEGKVKDEIKKLLKSRGIYYTMPIGGAFSAIGVPDFLCCYKGRFIGIEAKAGNNKPTALQEKNLEDIRKAGGIALVINEKNLNALIYAIISIDNDAYALERAKDQVNLLDPCTKSLVSACQSLSEANRKLEKLKAMKENYVVVTDYQTALLKKCYHALSVIENGETWAGLHAELKEALEEQQDER